MSIILDGLVDGNLLITEGLGELVTGYVPVILQFDYDLSDIVSGKPSTPFTAEQISALILQGLFVITDVQTKPHIRSGSSIRTSEVYVEYVGNPLISQSMGLKNSEVWSVFLSVGEMVVTAVKPSLTFYSKVEKYLPQVSSVEGDQLFPVIVSTKEEN